MRFVPVNLGLANRTTGEPNARKALLFSPSARTVQLAKAPPLANPCTGRDGFDSGHWTDDFEVHCAGTSGRHLNCTFIVEPVSLGRMTHTNDAVRARMY